MTAGRSVLVAGLAGGLALFAWSVVSWHGLPLHDRVFRPIPDEARVVDALREHVGASGVYVFPSPPPEPEGAAPADTEKARDAWEARSRAGPVGLLVYRSEGVPPNRRFRPFAKGLLADLGAAVFSAFALSRLRIGGYAARVAFVVGLGLFAWVLGPVSQWAWFRYPDLWLASTLLDAALGWLIVGTVQAGIVRPRESRRT